MAGAGVRDADGKAVPAEVRLSMGGGFGFGLPVVVSAGADGTFALSNLDPEDAVAPRVRWGNAVNVPAAIPVGGQGDPAAITVSEANACRLTGRVTDARGSPVPGARVSVHWHVQGVGKRAGFGTVSALEHLTADADGRYRSSALWPGDRYHVRVAARGYGQFQSDEVLGVAGRTHEVPDARLSRSDLTVVGIAVDAAGKPVGGAAVFNRGDGERAVEATADAAGRFTLSGYRDAPGFAFARKDGYRLAVAPADPGGEPVRLVLRRTADPPAGLPAAADHAAALDRAARHLLAALGAARAGLGADAERKVFRSAAQFDPALARRWADEAAAGGRTDLAARLAAIEVDRKLLAAATADPDEALAMIAGRPGPDGFDAVYDLAARLRPLDGAKASRVADEAVAQARGLDMPRRAWCLARAGFLAVRCGNSAGGKAVVLEAAALAERLPAAGMSGLYRGYAAGLLAPFDRDRALRMLDAYTEPDHYNRYLALAVDRVAAFDPAAAREMLDRFRSGNSFYPHDGRLYLAYRTAAADPDGAAKAVAEIPEPMYRAIGYTRLARLAARTDRPRAWKLIDAAYSEFDRSFEEFRGWSNFGGAAAAAAAVTVVAKEVG